MNLEKTEREIFNIWYRELGYPMAASLRAEMKAETLADMGQDEADLDGDPDLQGNYLVQLENHIKGGLLITKHTPNSTSSNNKLVGTKGLYRKAFDRRFRLVEFVISVWAANSYDIDNWEHWKQETRINWKLVTNEWNKANPYDQFENPMSLRSLYNQAIRQSDILLNLAHLQIAQGMKAIRKEGQTFENQIKDAEREFLSQAKKGNDGYSEWFAFLLKRFVKNVPNQSELESRYNFIINSLIVKYLKPIKGGTE